MQTIEQYLGKTQSATQKLFEGVDSYKDILRDIKLPMFISSTLDKSEFEKEYAVWSAENEEDLKARRDAEEVYIAESFALANLCGALLQTASMGFSQFSCEQVVPPAFKGIITEGHQVTKYCIGREVRSVPIGLIVHAGRNQYNHYDERPKLRNPAKKVFEILADMGKDEQGKAIVDPAFNLGNQRLICFASNITAVLGWNTYEDYHRDMLTTLG